MTTEVKRWHLSDGGITCEPFPPGFSWQQYVEEEDFDRLQSDHKKLIGEFAALSQDDGKKDREIERLEAGRKRLEEGWAEDRRVWHEAAEMQRKLRPDPDAQVRELQAALTASRAAEGRLREALRLYGKHDDDCEVERYSDAGEALECACGLFQVLAATAESEGT